MICDKCSMKIITKEKNKAMKRYTEKLKRKEYEDENNGLSDNKPKK